MKSVSYGRQYIDEDDIRTVSECLQGDLLTGGSYVLKFEKAFASRVQTKNCVTCSSGTAGLHLAMLALGIGANDVVIVPAITFAATANCVRYVRGHVCFADVDSETGLLTPETLHQAVACARICFPDKRLAAVVAVHLNGQTEDVAALGAICAAENAALILDSCHALGTTWGPVQTPVGAADVALCEVFSFHPVKTIAMGEGGAVTTQDQDFAERLRLYRSHGITRDASQFQDTTHAFDAVGGGQAWHYEMLALGYNYRLSDIHCALGLSQLTKLDVFKKKRCELLAVYRSAFAQLPEAFRFVPDTGHSSACWHLASGLIDFDALNTSRNTVMLALKQAGIGTQVHYIPVFRHPYWVKYLSLTTQTPEVDCAGALSYFARQLSLPLHMSVTDEHVKRVVQTLETFY